ncbi:MAG: beta-ketoacyl-ACP synthase [Rhizobiaceae bacterium]
MGDRSNPVWITGIGLLSALGEGPQAHWDAMNSATPQNLDTERFAPYPVHRVVEVDWAQQISRRDMRQMEPWQQIGTYAAGLALDDANAKENADLLGRMDMIVSAGGGERDIEVDTAIINEGRTANDREAMLTERLSNDLRPTLFLAQLSNLLAGNISIVHKVTGSSRTFMGEEGAGISAVKTAHARIASGQSDIVLVGGAFNGEREDMLLLFELGQYLAQGDPKPVWSREGDSSGLSLGSMGVFLVLESEAHARKRGVTPYGALDAVAADHGKREAGAASARLTSALEQIGGANADAVLSGASGVEDITSEERQWLATNLPEAPARAFGTMTGHGVETHFPLGVALAAIAVKNNQFYGALEAAEAASDGAPDNILVTTVGHYRAEGLGLVSSIDE